MSLMRNCPMTSVSLTTQLKEKLQRLIKLRKKLQENRAKRRFKHFFNDFWSQSIIASEGFFVKSDHFDRWCDELQYNKFTSKESARKHGKSEILHAYAVWLFFIGNKSWDLAYFSYKQKLSNYHTRLIKKSMLEMDCFNGVKWNSPADTIIDCNWPNSKINLRIVPYGFKGAKRGIHPHGIFCDDILKDPTQRKLNVNELKELGRIFAEEVLSMPKEGGFLHCWGTSQDPTDLFNENRKRPNFLCSINKAIYTVKGIKKALWASLLPLKRLEEIRNEIHDTAFNKEYQCSPVRGEEGYFHDDEIELIIDENLKQVNPLTYETENPVYGGLDIGKKRHPSHFVLFELIEGDLIQIFSKWMDGWGYVEQFEYLQALDEGVDNLNIECVNYDNTRGEFEVYEEKSELPEWMVPINFSVRSKMKMAVTFENRIRAKGKPTIYLLKDGRQKRQILSVDNDLHAMETPEGHGDSFWSNGLACMAFEEGAGDYLN